MMDEKVSIKNLAYSKLDIFPSPNREAKYLLKNMLICDINKSVDIAT